MEPANALDDVEEFDDDQTGRFIRPYAMTGGRTTAQVEIELESQLQATHRKDAATANYRWEKAKVLQLAERPIALVELAARAELPIGVARVIVADLITDRALMAQTVASTQTNYTSLLEKVLDGVRSL